VRGSTPEAVSQLWGGESAAGEVLRRMRHTAHRAAFGSQPAAFIRVQ